MTSLYNMNPLAPRIGQTRNGYQMRSLHGDRVKKEPPVKREATPDMDEDVNRPPEDTSEEESIKAGSEFEEEPCAKRRKASGSNDYEAMDREPRRSPSEPPETRARLSNEPSNISASIFTTSQKNGDDELGGSFSQPSQPRRRKQNTYTNHAAGNMHVKVPKPKDKKNTQPSPAKVSISSKGFKTIGMPSALSEGPRSESEGKEESKFRVPRRIEFDTPRAKRASLRSARNASSPADDKESFTSQVHKLSSSHDGTPTKAKKSRPTFIRREVPEIASPPRVPLKQLLPAQQPFTSSLADDVGTDDLVQALEAQKNARFLPAKARAPSTTESSLLSASNRAGSSSPLSSPPTSLDGDNPLQLEVYDIPAPKVTTIRNPDPPPALCPVCKAPVDRAFLEEFHNGNALRYRQQTQFCKAHKIRDAREEWKDKGYPNIDWARFDKRLQEYHPVIEDMLAGKKTSYYRNVYEDSISKRQAKSLGQELRDTSAMEGRLPGYYGTRGARALIENITSKFAPRIRRLATSDQVISKGGVPTYIQAVLAPELAVLLVKDDMKVDEDGARAIIRDSVGIGILLNEELDEAIHEIESDDELAM